MTFLKFLVVGVGNTAVGLSSMWLLMEPLGVEYRIANICGYAAGLVHSYLWNKFWTFQSKQLRGTEMIRFVVAFAVSFFLQLGVVVLLVEAALVPKFTAQVLGLSVYTPTNYFLNKKWTFHHG